MDPEFLHGLKRTVPTHSEPRYSQSLIRGLAILEGFTPGKPARRIIDIASELEMSASTTHRYATTLAAMGYLEPTAARWYRLGTSVSDVGMQAVERTRLRKKAWPYMQHLRDKHPSLVTLAALDGSEIVCLACAHSHVRGQTMIDPELRVRAGSRLPAHCTAAGKVLLAALSSAARKQAVSQMKLRAYGPATITNKLRLENELKEIAGDRSLAICDQELAPELQAIAVPILHQGETRAALELGSHGCIERTEFASQYIRSVLDTAQRISSDLANQLCAWH